MKGFLLGVRCGFRGLGACISTPRLWPWAIVPGVVALLIFTALFSWAGSSAVETARRLAVDLIGEGAGSWAVGATATVVAAVAAVVLYFVFGPFTRVVAAPFLALLSDRWVRELAQCELPPPIGSAATRFLVVPIRDALLFLVVRLVITTLLLPVLCVPVVGAFLFAALLTPLEGMDRMDVAASSRGVPVSARLQFPLKHFGACVGLGTVATLLLLVPCVNILLLPGIAVAAVMLDRELSDDFPGKPAQ